MTATSTPEPVITDPPTRPKAVVTDEQQTATAMGFLGTDLDASPETDAEPNHVACIKLPLPPNKRIDIADDYTLANPQRTQQQMDAFAQAGVFAASGPSTARIYVVTPAGQPYVRHLVNAVTDEWSACFAKVQIHRSVTPIAASERAGDASAYYTPDPSAASDVVEWYLLSDVAPFASNKGVQAQYPYVKWLLDNDDIGWKFRISGPVSPI